MGESHTLFESPGNVYSWGVRNHPKYDVTPDGQRFLMVRWVVAPDARQEVIVVQNFFEELERLSER